jgi:hypothetical protein
MVASAFPTHEPTERYCRFFLRIITSCFQLWCCVLAVFFSAGITELPTAQHSGLLDDEDTGIDETTERRQCIHSGQMQIKNSLPDPSDN